jgi:hypothetical protein
MRNTKAFYSCFDLTTGLHFSPVLLVQNVGIVGKLSRAVDLATTGTFSPALLSV